MLEKVNWKLFIDDIENCEYIICIGAGKGLRRMEEIFGETSLVKKIKYVADNDHNKQGTEIVLNKTNIVIQSVPSLLPVVTQNVVIVITSFYCLDILAQLESYDEFSQVKKYYYTHIYGAYLDDIAMKKQIPDNIRLSEQILIPKVIHYCWFGRTPIPEKYKVWMRSWKKYCPDYEIIEWNEDNYDITKNQYMLQAYENKKWGFVSDYARLDIIYNFGGIYLDTDVELIKNIDDLLYQRGYVGFECDEYVNTGLGFGAVAGNMMIKGMRDSYDEYSFVDAEGNINLTPCPIIQTEYLLTQGLQQNGEYQILRDELTIYPEKMLSGKGGNSRQITLMPYTCSIHHFAASWMDEKDRKNRELVASQLDRINRIMM